MGGLPAQARLRRDARTWDALRDDGVDVDARRQQRAVLPVAEKCDGCFAFDFDGKKVWSTPLESFPTILDFGTASSPAQLGDLVIIVNDNEKQQFIAAFDKNRQASVAHES